MNFSTVTLQNSNSNPYRPENYDINPLRQAEGDGFYYAAKTNKQLIADCYASGGSPIVSGGGQFIQCDGSKISRKVTPVMMGADGFYNADGTLMIADVAKHYNVPLEKLSSKYNVPVSTLKVATVNDVSIKTHTPVDTVIKQISDMSPVSQGTAPKGNGFNSLLNLLSFIPKGDSTNTPAPIAPIVTQTEDPGFRIGPFNGWAVVGTGAAVAIGILVLVLRKKNK